MSDQIDLTLEQQAVNAETWKHIDLVERLLARMQIELMRRQFTHDRSKLEHPEVSMFAEMTPKLAGLTYGSEEYEQCRQYMLRTALGHHYAHNRHHPEYFEPCSEDKAICNHLAMAEWAIDNAQVLPDDIYGYEQLRSFLNRKQVEAQSSVNRMNLIDILEMLCDWKAATARHNDGDIVDSIEINATRFGLSPQLVQILLNTLPLLEDPFAGMKTQKDITD